MKRRMKRGRAVGKTMLIAGALAAVMAIGGISAYFTATDNLTNSWTVGKVDIELQEPRYDEAEAERANIAPNQELTKDPQISNTGSNEAFVFLRIIVPKANVKVASQDGGEINEAMQELFDYAVDENWVRINRQEGEDHNTYVFAYGNESNCTVLAPSEKTSVFFKGGKIRFKNVIEGQGLDGMTLEMPVEAFAIQTTDMTENDSAEPSRVWSVLNGQLEAE